MVFSGRRIFSFTRRLGGNWKDLAIVAEIPTSHQRQWSQGFEAIGIVEWLESHGQLEELPGHLRYIDREDLEKLLIGDSDEFDDGRQKPALEHELVEIVLDDPIDAIEIRKCFIQSVGEFWVDPPETKSRLVYAIFLADDAEKGSSRLESFIRLINPLLQPESQEKLHTWRDTAKHLEMISSSAAATPTTNETTYSLIIAMDESKAFRPEIPKWMPRAWLHCHGTRTHELLDIQSDLDGETRESMRSYLERLRQLVASRVANPGEVIFEFFVSRTCLLLDIDQWKIIVDDLIGTGPLGFENPVVIRDLERTDYSRVRTRWKRLMSLDRLTVGNANAPQFNTSVRVASTEDCDPRQLYQEFVCQDDLQCLVVPECVSPDADLKQQCWIAAGIVAGVPIILWPRDSQAAKTLELEALRLLSKSPRLLPWEVHHLRQGRTALASHLSVLFENGNMDLPSALRHRNQPLKGARS